MLLVPNLNWEVRHHFPELEGDGKRFLNAGFNSYYIAKAMQTIRFKLDRSGAEVMSEAQNALQTYGDSFHLRPPVS